MAEMRTTKRLLPCNLSDDEVADRAQDLAKAEIYRGQVETDYLAAESDWKAQKKLWEGKVSTASEACLRMGRVVKDRQEDREVECQPTVRNGQYYLIRLDTGEIVLQRPATTEELQLTLPEIEQ
jgi:hypothetical protein